MSKPLPQVILGNPVSGEGSDTTRTAFAKYNAHNHGESLGSFYQTTVEPGQFIEAKNSSNLDIDLLPPSTIVSALDASTLFLSNSALFDSEEEVEVLINGVLYKNLSITQGSSEVALQTQPGFVSSKLITASLRCVESVHIQNPAQGHVTYLLIHPSFSGVIESISGVTSENQCTVTVKKNGVSLLPSAVITSSPVSESFEFSLTNNVLFTSADTVSIELTSISGPLTLDFNLYYQKR